MRPDRSQRPPVGWRRHRWRAGTAAAAPVVVEDDAMIGSRCMVTQGARVGGVRSARVILNPGIPVIDAETGDELRGASCRRTASASRLAAAARASAASSRCRACSCSVGTSRGAEPPQRHPARVRRHRLRRCDDRPPGAHRRARRRLSVSRDEAALPRSRRAAAAGRAVARGTGSATTSSAAPSSTTASAAARRAPRHRSSQRERARRTDGDVLWGLGAAGI